ncbi:2-keto-4-pentenoate hydratase [Bhargavaea cecembensis]|uniref:2-keto-4-pentenoate hydratase n=1 Tax=Bhargavaea cecembensis TaxID=394098 RepID=UPI00058BF24B|nr:2-keto-4-pentenoate hydratase [Bhargavaea cecembensis]
MANQPSARTVEIAKQIEKAYETRKPIDFIRHQYSLREDEAYKVQDEWVRRWCGIGRDRIIGYKISMTSPETQAIAGTDEPAYGTLLNSHIVKSGATVHLSALFEPLIEPEIMFILQEDLSPEASAEEILSKSKIAPGIEIPDARYKNWYPNFSLADLICDNTATGLVALSEPVDPPPLEKMADIGMELYKDDKLINRGNSSAVLGNPATAVVWLSKKLAEHERMLEKDMVISSGTFLSPIPATPGIYKALYPGVGRVEIEFVR